MSKTRLSVAEKKMITSTDICLSAIESSINHSKTTFELLKKREIRLFDGLYHLCIYSAIAQADLTLLTEKYNLSKRDYERLLFGRLIALFIIEFIDDINSLIGRDLLRELDKMNYFSSFIPPFKDINKQFSILKKNNDKMLRRIRNNSTAHKSKDSFLLHENVYGIDAQSILLLSVDVLNLSNRITIESEKIVRRIISLCEETISLMQLMETNNKENSG